MCSVFLFRPEGQTPREQVDELSSMIAAVMSREVFLFPRHFVTICQATNTAYYFPFELQHYGSVGDIFNCTDRLQRESPGNATKGG